MYDQDKSRAIKNLLQEKEEINAHIKNNSLEVHELKNEFARLIDLELSLSELGYKPPQGEPLDLDIPIDSILRLRPFPRSWEKPEHRELLRAEHPYPAHLLDLKDVLNEVEGEYPEAKAELDDLYAAALGHESRGREPLEIGKYPSSWYRPENRKLLQKFSPSMHDLLNLLEESRLTNDE
ncbi:hypothetical protein [Aestuariirhabdus litorea]|uniref:Uncharacterized protein n=1 Tax=Aestuariirhabdus litorea TaxID=2528527 RepID=A0A3P3VIP3_9GAMM|nr:hypothetical protein [Aestuariirhabdus litorea]RRJ82590.1 hypothetical protein D0544_12045 [Aestuariirhabdus litorea]RWW92749.1 hypothetical protein DZC74_12020 [Endozoicomonadaceae bacterium GTF-13]